MSISPSSQDKKFLLKTVKLAEKGRYSCHPNPRVGCIIVVANEAVASGWHKKSGDAHAEVNAIAEAKKKGLSIKGATAYVSLEPCSFTGKTPPCVAALIEVGITRVVCASLDPNPKVAGNGLKLLQQSGIDAFVLEDQEVNQAAEWLNRGFFKRMRTNKPWVMLKTASSLDGRTADNQGISQWITGEKARQDVHKLRAENGAVITGSGTQQSDNPSLNARIDDFHNDSYHQPLRVLLDSECRVAVTDKIVSDDQGLLIFTTAKKDSILETFNGKAEIQQLSLQKTHQHIDLKAVLAHLAEKEINNVLIESGGTLSGSFLSAGLVDEIVHYIAPSVIGSAGRGMFDFSVPLALKDRKHFKIKSVEQVGDDIKIVYVRDSYS